jgi:nucleoside-diphosphate-sugar epimerase
MKTLVTGATGFIGSHLVDALVRQGFEVHCIVRDTAKLRFLEGANVNLIKGDCSDFKSLEDAVKGFDYIFHLAGVTKASRDEDYFAANAAATGNIIKAVVENNPEVKRFVHLSSLAAAGPSPDGALLTEDMPSEPVSVYGRSKLQGETLAYAAKGRIPVTIIRPPAVYGPRDRDLLVFFKMVKSGIVPYWGKSYYSFIYVDDLINGIILSAQSREAAGEIFYMTDGNVYSSDDIIAAISEALLKTPIKLSIPKFVMPLLGLVSEKIKGAGIINADKIRELRHSFWVCSGQKAVEKLGFEPKVKIKEATVWTADWYKIHRWL